MFQSELQGNVFKMSWQLELHWFGMEGWSETSWRALAGHAWLFSWGGEVVTAAQHCWGTKFREEAKASTKGQTDHPSFPFKARLRLSPMSRAFLSGCL